MLVLEPRFYMTYFLKEIEEAKTYYGICRMPIMLRLDLRGFIGVDVNFAICDEQRAHIFQVPFMYHGGQAVRLTEHIAFLVLSSLLGRNVSLKTKPYHRGILHRVFAYIQSSDDAEPTSVVHIFSQALELRPQSWKREVVRANIVPV